MDSYDQKLELINDGLLRQIKLSQAEYIVPIAHLMSCTSIRSYDHSIPRWRGGGSLSGPGSERVVKQPRGHHQVLPTKGNEIREND